MIVDEVMGLHNGYRQDPNVTNVEGAPSNPTGIDDPRSVVMSLFAEETARFAAAADTAGMSQEYEQCDDGVRYGLAVRGATTDGSPLTSLIDIYRQRWTAAGWDPSTSEEGTTTTLSRPPRLGRQPA